MNELKIIRKIMRIGDSIGILIGCMEKGLLNVNAGDIVEVIIKKLPKEEKMITVKCTACEGIFNVTQEDLDEEYECPACENKKFYKVNK